MEYRSRIRVHQTRLLHRASGYLGISRTSATLHSTKLGKIQSLLYFKVFLFDQVLTTSLAVSSAPQLAITVPEFPQREIHEARLLLGNQNYNHGCFYRCLFVLFRKQNLFFLIKSSNSLAKANCFLYPLSPHLYLSNCQINCRTTYQYR